MSTADSVSDTPGAVRLVGELVCSDQHEIDLVERHLSQHLTSTRAEPGCVSFEVRPTDDPTVWQVDEMFSSAGAFQAHQARVADSDWGRATAAIERRYQVDGL